MKWIFWAIVVGVVGAAAFRLDTDDVRRFIASFQPTPAPVAVVVVTATPDDTPTGTSTATLVPSLTPTSTLAPVIAAVPAITATRTPIPTATLRPTFTPTVTRTATSTATGTATGTPTTTPTVTATAFVCGHVEMVLMGAGKEHRHCHTPTPTLAPGATRAPAPTFTPTPANTSTPTQIAKGTPIPTNTPRTILVPLHTNAPAPSTTPPTTQTSSPSVRAIYAVPSDRAEDPRLATVVNKAILSVQHWYAEQLDGLTFMAEGPTPQICNVKNKAAYYEGKDGWNRVLTDVQHCAPVSHFSTHFTWVIYIDAAYDCSGAGELGRGGDGVTILHRGDLEGLATPDTYELCGWWPRGEGGWFGGLAHELGHAFGLSHPDGCNLDSCDDISVMGSGFYHYPETFLNDGDGQSLKASPFFTHRVTNTPASSPIPTSVHTATPILAQEQTDSPHLSHLSEKQYMLELINTEREKAGLNPVELGDNIAAQLHAESALENCFSSHWGIDGLKPYMRYSLAGGYQSNGENGHGSDYCIKERDGYRAIRSATEEVRQAVEGWMESPGHRRNILGRFHKKVNIGLAWDRFNFLAYQHFEGDYVEFSELPDIENGGLTFEGTTKNGVQFAEKNDLGVQIYYDAKPRQLTRGQVSRTYCYDNGLPVAALRPPLARGWRYPQTAYTRIYKPCPNPYKVRSDAPAPSSHVEAGKFWQEAYDASRTRQDVTIHVPWITASMWTASGESFSVKANINEVLEEHGDGVYTIIVWGDIDGERAVISEYSIFHGITPPDAYTPR